MILIIVLIAMSVLKDMIIIGNKFIYFFNNSNIIILIYYNNLVPGLENALDKVIFISFNVFWELRLSFSFIA